MAPLIVGTGTQSSKIRCKDYVGAGRDSGFTAAEGERDGEQKSIGNQASLVLLFPLTNELKPSPKHFEGKKKRNLK